MKHREVGRHRNQTKDEGNETQGGEIKKKKMKAFGGGGGLKCTQGAMHEYTGQSGRGQPIRGLRCESRQLQTERQAGRQTGLEVERLSQIKIGCTDQPGIYMCLFNKSDQPWPRHATMSGHKQKNRIKK